MLQSFTLLISIYVIFIQIKVTLNDETQIPERKKIIKNIQIYKKADSSYQILL